VYFATLPPSVVIGVSPIKHKEKLGRLIFHADRFSSRGFPHLLHLYFTTISNRSSPVLSESFACTRANVREWQITFMGKTSDPRISETGRLIALKFSAIACLAETFLLPPVRPRSDSKREIWERTLSFSVSQKTPQRVPISTWSLEFLCLLGNCYWHVEFANRSLSGTASSESFKTPCSWLAF
jgi:hypothetical protein